MPGVVCVLVMMEGFEVSMRSRMLPDSMRVAVGSFTIFWAGLNGGLFSETMDFREFPSVLSAVRIGQSLYLAHSLPIE